MKAIQISRILIHCDSCHAEFEGDPFEWHGKACSNCGAEDIIDDNDIGIWKATLKGMDAINAAVGEVPDDTPAISTFTVDTAPFRDKGKQ